jgi:hypothetical protein
MQTYRAAHREIFVGMMSAASNDAGLIHGFQEI